MRKQPAAFAEMQKNLEYIEVLASVLTTEVMEQIDEDVEKLRGETIGTLPCCPDLQRPPLRTSSNLHFTKLFRHCIFQLEFMVGIDAPGLEMTK